MATLTVHSAPLQLRRFRLRIGLVVAIMILAGSNVVSNRVLTEVAYIPWNLSVAALLVFMARRFGLTWADLGLHNERLRRGLAIGAIAAGAVMVIYAIGWSLPATRSAFDDQRAAGSVHTLLFMALIQIPLGTVVLEEVAFRGVLPAFLGTSRFWPTALASSVLFGFWHVLPSIGVTSANAAMGAAVGTIGLLAQTVLVVLAMTGAGMLLMAYRRWGGHLVAPALVHVATNSLGVLIAWLVITA